MTRPFKTSSRNLCVFNLNVAVVLLMVDSFLLTYGPCKWPLGVSYYKASKVISVPYFMQENTRPFQFCIFHKVFTRSRISSSTCKEVHSGSRCPLLCCVSFFLVITNAVLSSGGEVHAWFIYTSATEITFQTLFCFVFCFVLKKINDAVNSMRCRVRFIQRSHFFLFCHYI